MARRSWSFRLLLLAGSTGVALVGAELGFRWFGPGTGGYGPGAFYTPNGIAIPVAEIANYLSGGGHLGGGDLEPPAGRLTPSLRVKQGYDRPRWDYFDAPLGIEVRHNSRGFRDEEFPVEKPAGEFRVLAFGDSFTWGSGVLAEDAWPHIVEGRLRQGGSAQVVNCGFACGTYNPTGYDAWLRSDGLLLSPDMVIVGFCLNDMEPKSNAVPMLSYEPPKPEPSFSAILAYAMWTQAVRAARQRPHDFTPVVANDPTVWNAVQQALRDLKRTCDDNGIALVLAIFPMLSQLDIEPYPYAGLITMVREFCADAGIRCLDLGPEFIGRTDELELWVHPTDQHPNHVGHEIMGNRIFEFLQAEGLLPE
ncbi:MAG: SGNH/GDSL hydrolase family protein [bacterium]|nr:SGNH/GDSL hydrolase family protein [bacterium]